MSVEVKWNLLYNFSLYLPQLQLKSHFIYISTSSLPCFQDFLSLLIYDASIFDSAVEIKCVRLYLFYNCLIFFFYCKAIFGDKCSVKFDGNKKSPMA